MGVEQARIREVGVNASPGGTRPGRSRAGHGEKASSEAFSRRDPALTQKLVFLFRKTDTKTYQFWNCRRLTGRWSCIGWKSAGNDTKTYHHLFPLYAARFLPSSPILPSSQSFEHGGSLRHAAVRWWDSAGTNAETQAKLGQVEFRYLSQWETGWSLGRSARGLFLMLGVKADYCLPWNSLHFSFSMSLSIDDLTFDSHSLCFRYATPVGSWAAIESIASISLSSAGIKPFPGDPLIEDRRSSKWLIDIPSLSSVRMRVIALTLASSLQSDKAQLII